MLKIWWRLVMTCETCLNMNNFYSRLRSCYKLNCQSLRSKSRTPGSSSHTLRVRKALRSSLLAEQRKAAHISKHSSSASPGGAWQTNACCDCPFCQLSQNEHTKTNYHTKMPNPAPICKNRSPSLIQRGIEAHFRRNLQIGIKKRC